MRGLTILQPWCWSMAAGLKLVENRPWAPPRWMIGRRFALHAGKRWDWEAYRMIGARLGPLDLPVPARDGVAFGAVVAVCRLVCVVTSAAEAELRAGHGQGKWFLGRFGWVVDDMQRLPEPVPCRGYQKLWTLPPDVEIAVRRQVGEAA